MTEHEFTAALWRWQARDEETSGAWFFVSLPFDVADAIEDETGPRKGFGSVRVEVSVGGSTWRTSVFPSAEEKTFVLPVKKAVRVAEGLAEGASCRVRVRTV
ncbi:DUF1905 domain-containing protein [Nocardioides sp. WV_118_6]|uniref:DUF1905 domain-containing protein n=1 Tax=Nocardioides simplex TaxID=2045 RepID=UPI0021505C6A|nr:DUF1905 domain-containing protein [Pimelobacter simplex]UUW91817.1 DUF1905 domain-containing protein [Pimelobacter simplex]UUW95645.1 DUF1905 domain-containing protein [Pimelobacter simplex]